MAKSILIGGGEEVNRAQIATAVVLRDLNCGTLETIGDRILLQKKVFLAQNIGLPLGYGYSWYIHGPYSTDLTAAAYQIIPEGFDSIKDNYLKDPYDKMILRVNTLENDIVANDLQIGVVQWYELVASIAYWYQHGYKTKEEVVSKIKETKPQFSDREVRAAYNSYLAFKQIS